MDNIRILAGRILVKPDAIESKTEGGIYIPPSMDIKSNKGTVVARGDDLPDVKMELKTGDRVIYPENTGTEVEIEDVKYILMEQWVVIYFIRP